MALADQHSWIFRVEINSVTDGDTIKVTVDYGFTVSQKWALRFKDIDTPEIFGRVEPGELALGRKAKQQVIDWLSEHIQDSGYFWVRTDKDRRTFNRYIAEEFECSCGDSLFDYLRELGYADNEKGMGT